MEALKHYGLIYFFLACIIDRILFKTWVINSFIANASCMLHTCTCYRIYHVVPPIRHLRKDSFELVVRATGIYSIVNLTPTKYWSFLQFSVNHYQPPNSHRKAWCLVSKYLLAELSKWRQLHTILSWHKQNEWIFGLPLANKVHLGQCASIAVSLLHAKKLFVCFHPHYSYHLQWIMNTVCMAFHPYLYFKRNDRDF